MIIPLNNTVINRIRNILFMLLLQVSGFTAISQDHGGFIDTLAARFQKYCALFPWEEIYIHTDRRSYVAGENLWFESYLLDRRSNSLSAENSILYFEILNTDNVPVVQKRIIIDRGYGPGQASLPDTLSSGLYSIRAYTNWMKNFMPANCFLSKIRIVNALNVSEQYIQNDTIYASDKLNSGRKIITEPSEFNLEVDHKSPESLKLTITTGQKNEMNPDAICFLIIQTHGIIDYRKTITLKDGMATPVIPAKILTQGINQITVFNQSGQPVAEKYIYTPEVVLNLPEILYGDTVGRREKVIVKIDGITDARKDSSKFSVSVSTDNIDSGIDSYMVFGSEFGPLPEQLINRGPGKLAPEMMEEFLSGTKSRWINWDSILSGTYPDIRFKREGRYHFLCGRLISRESRKPLSDEYLFLSTPGKTALFQYAITDQNGGFCFTLPINEKLNDLIIQPGNDGKEKSIRLISPFAQSVPGSIYEQVFSTTGTSPSVSSMVVNYQIGKIYGNTDDSGTAKIKIPEIPPKRFYGRPDIELKMDDYIKLPVMQEVFFELIPGVVLRNKKSVWEMKLFDQASNRLMEIPPVMLVDGVVVSDPAIIALLDPDIVEKIEVVREKYYVGNYLLSGIVNVITRAGDFSNVALPDYAMRLSYRVAEKIVDFKSPDYSTNEKRISRIPDFRNTLYWNPCLEPDSGGRYSFEFWTSDFSSDYVIKVQGITSGSRRVSINKNIKVR